MHKLVNNNLVDVIRPEGPLLLVAMAVRPWALMVNISEARRAETLLMPGRGGIAKVSTLRALITSEIAHRGLTATATKSVGPLGYDIRDVFVHYIGECR